MLGNLSHGDAVKPHSLKGGVTLAHTVLYKTYTLPLVTSLIANYALNFEALRNARISIMNINYKTFVSLLCTVDATDKKQTLCNS